MKRLLSLVCALAMAFSLTACGAQNGGSSSSTHPTSSTPPSSSTATQEQPENSQPTPGNESSPSTEENSTPESTETDTVTSKALVVYFSATGTTEKLAGYISEVTAGDLYEIVPAEPYTSDDLNYSDNNSRSTKEQNDESARPAISGSVENMEQYDIIFLGYPIWWGEAPRIVSTFMESYAFAGKTIVPFCTSGGSGLGSSARNLHGLADSDVTWLDGTRLESGISHEEMVGWIDGLGLDVGAQ